MLEEAFKRVLRHVKDDKPYENSIKGYELTVDQFKELEKEVELRSMRDVERVVLHKNLFLVSAKHRINYKNG
jgi:hypothetical protein